MPKAFSEQVPQKAQKTKTRPCTYESVRICELLFCPHRRSMRLRRESRYNVCGRNYTPPRQHISHACTNPDLTLYLTCRPTSPYLPLLAKGTPRPPLNILPPQHYFWTFFEPCLERICAFRYFSWYSRPHSRHLRLKYVFLLRAPLRAWHFTCFKWWCRPCLDISLPHMGHVLFVSRERVGLWPQRRQWLEV